MRKILAAILLIALTPTLAFAQAAVRQNGSVTSNNVTKWNQDHIVKDAGGTQGDNTGVGVNPFAVTDNNSLGLCFNTAAIGLSPNTFCLGHASNGTAIATVNGIQYNFPFSVGGIIGPGTSVVDNVAAWNNTTGGLLKDPGVSWRGIPHQATILFPGPNCLSSSFPNPAIPWIAVTPDGSAVPGINSTQSNGFNEVEAYDFTKGWSTIVYGGGGGIAGAVFACEMNTTTLAGFVVKPLNNRTLNLIDVFMACTGNANGGCLNIDSAIEGWVFSTGSQVAVRPNGCVAGFTGATGIGANGTAGVIIKPTNPVPVENVIAVGNSRFILPQVAVNCPSGNADAVLVLDSTSGVIGANLIDSNEFNGQGQAGASTHVNYGIVLRNGTNPIQNNTINVSGENHFGQLSAIRVGGTSNSGNYHFNTFNSQKALTANASANVIDNYSLQNVFNITSIDNSEGAYSCGILNESTANGNRYMIGFMAGGGGCTSTLGISDLASWKNDYYIGSGGGWINRYEGGRVVNFLPPTSVTGCGAGTTLQAGSTNAAGTIIIGANTTTCTLNFSITYPNAPASVVSSNQGGTYLSAGGGTINLTIGSNINLPATAQVSYINR